MSALIRMDRNSEAKRAVVGTVSFFKEAKVWGRTQLVGEALLLKIKKEETTGKQRRTARQLQTAEGISGAEGQRARLPEKRRRDWIIYILQTFCVTYDIGSLLQIMNLHDIQIKPGRSDATGVINS